jgi:hypothetical protein
MTPRLAILGAMLATGCNAIFGIKEGMAPPSGCSDALMIDDMEDGDGQICDSINSAGRHGSWFTIGDGTGTQLEPAPGSAFKPALIPGGRGASRYAARVTGSGFTAGGAAMGLNLNVNGLSTLPYNASTTGGITVWMKSNVPVAVAFPIPATIPIGQGGGACSDVAGENNCGNHFQWLISAPTPGEWAQYQVPYAALGQPLKNDAQGNTVFGSATWDPANLVGIQFLPSAASFDVWVDDIQFYGCSTTDCVPTCTDPQLPVACPAAGGTPAGCFPAATDCSGVPVLASVFGGVWGSGPSDVWAVGASSAGHTGTILHWNGSAWSATSSGPTALLSGVWGSGASDVWAVGDRGAAVHWNGAAWSAVVATGTTQSLGGVWGSGPSDVWAVGHGGTILHWDGTTWSPVPSGTTLWLGGVWGSGPGDVWAVGHSDTFDAGVIVHWDGSAWSVIPNGAPQPLLGVWGSGPDDVWAVGPGIVHWDGAAWSAIPGGVPGQLLVGVWGTGPSDVWAVGYSFDAGVIVHWDGSAWSVIPNGAPQPLFGVWGSGPGDVWAVGTLGTIVHWTGSAWSVVPPSAIR